MVGMLWCQCFGESLWSTRFLPLDSFCLPSNLSFYTAGQSGTEATSSLYIDCSVMTADPLLILQAALSSELAIIQGPPGTGKSYVGVQIVRALLANTTPTAPPTTQQLRRGPRDPTPQTAIGPIWVVCLTNHALDQFLEDLLEAGISSIVRVGGGYYYLSLHASANECMSVRTQYIM